MSIGLNYAYLRVWEDRGKSGDAHRAADCDKPIGSAKMVAESRHASVGLASLNARDVPCEPGAPIAAVLAQCVASYRTRATTISPGHALHTPLSGCAYGWPGGGFAISPQSRLHLDRISHSEIAARLQICHQATYSRGALAKCVISY